MLDPKKKAKKLAGYRCIPGIPGIPAFQAFQHSWHSGIPAFWHSTAFQHSTGIPAYHFISTDSQQLDSQSGQTAAAGQPGYDLRTVIPSFLPPPGIILLAHY